MEKLGLGAASEPGVAPDSDDEDAPASTTLVEAASEKEWPFSWTQTSDSVSVMIPLPAETTRKDVSVDLTSFQFTFYVATVDPSPALQAFLEKPCRQFWTTIDPELSTYTFDSSTCIFELNLMKEDANTRWPSVF